VHGVQQAAPASPDQDNSRGRRIILGLAGSAAAAYFALALAGDLRAHLVPYLLVHAALAATMLAAWRQVRADHRNLTLALAAALLFRLVATAGDPALSDDVYRYVWDGRVQVHGVHPYSHAPTDEALAALRDADWERINHPEVKTIYPPLAQMVFFLLAALGTGPVGFKLAMGLADFGVVLALSRLLRSRGLPPDRVVLYAWNPLAVLETAGSGHLEPIGIVLVLLATGWIADGRRKLSALALAASVHVKLLPTVLAPGHLRRAGPAAAWVLLVALVLLWLPYGLTGPAVGAGLFDYAERWEHNAFVFAGVRGLMERVDTAALLKPLIGSLEERLGDAPAWDYLYRHVWPGDIARLLVALAVVAWTAYVVMRRETDPVRESILVLGAVLLLTPTLHPWYLLWLLPFAAARLSWAWLLFGATAPLAYWIRGDDVPWAVRCLEYLPPLALMIATTWRSRRSSGTPGLLAFRA
jgi:hypothetical protein